MQLTPNYKLKKPEGTDPVDIQDFNDNADLIDAALKKKAESSGGDISGMTVKTLDDITTEFPVPVAGESTKTFLGKVKKFFSDTKNWMTGVCLIGQIVNNCVTNNAKLPLSAAQGKVLMDLYNVLNTNFSNLSKWGIKAPMSGTGAINTYWVESGTVYYRAVNGTCVVYFDLWIKAVSIDDAVLATDIPYCWLGVYDYKINASSHAPAVFYIQDNALKCGKSNAGRYFGHLVYPTI